MGIFKILSGMLESIDERLVLNLRSIFGKRGANLVQRMQENLPCFVVDRLEIAKLTFQCRYRFMNLLCGHLFILRIVLHQDFGDGVAGDGGVLSSIEDFLIWDNFWYENKLISADLLAQTFVRPQLNDGSRSDYGFGWVITGQGAWHNGSWLGARTYYTRNSNDNTCIVALDNSSCEMVDSMGAKIEAALKK